MQTLSPIDRQIGTCAADNLLLPSLGSNDLVAKDSGTGNSRLFVLSSPVPKPQAYAMLLAGPGLPGAAIRRRQQG